jgi:hypothetical protein
MIVSGNNLCVTENGWYLVNFTVDSSTEVNNYVTYQLQNSSNTLIPQGSVSINTTASNLETINKSLLVYLSAGNCVHLAGTALNGGNVYIPAGSASITAVKISN